MRDAIKTFTTEVDGHKVTVEVRERHWSKGMTWREHDKKPRVYVSTKGETLLDNLANRTTRPYVAWRKVLVAAFQQLGFEGQLRWSQKAGCSCPCSPGFIWTGKSLVNGTYRFDVDVTLEDVPVVRDDPDAQAEQASRTVQVLADPTISPAALVGTRL